MRHVAWISSYSYCVIRENMHSIWVACKCNACSLMNVSCDTMQHVQFFAVSKKVLHVNACHAYANDSYLIHLYGLIIALFL